MNKYTLRGWLVFLLMYGSLALCAAGMAWDSQTLEQRTAHIIGGDR